MNPLSWIWQAGCALLGLIVLGLGIALWSTSSDLDQARADLKTEQGVSAELRAEIKIQNGKVDEWKGKADEAQENFRLAMEAAKGSGKKFDSISHALEGIKKGTSCGDAMPAVNIVLEGLK